MAVAGIGFMSFYVLWAGCRLCRACASGGVCLPVKILRVRVSLGIVSYVLHGVMAKRAWLSSHLAGDCGGAMEGGVLAGGRYGEVVVAVRDSGLALEAISGRCATTCLGWGG